MDFTSVAFLGFLAGVALLHVLIPQRWRCALLIASSYSFYVLWSGWFALLLLASTLIAFYAARARSLALSAAALLIAVLVLYKSLPLMGIRGLMPLGVSYYTFKLGAYLIDVHWGALEPETRLVPFLAYTAFFPQIVGGPIQRAQSFLPQVEQRMPLDAGMIFQAVLRILLGFFKKFAVADNLGTIVNYVYTHLNAHPGAPIALGFYGYPLQMYADFSGLTDIALGAGVLLGVVGPENFNAPFSAASPSDYWRRWHISLTQWMQDYVFTPLRMSLRNLGNIGLVLSLFINMIAIGLWHGFQWTFALFGMVHAVFLSADALTQKARKRLYKRSPAADRLTDWIGPLVTFHLIAVAFVFFRADSPAVAVALFSHLFDGWSGFAPEFHYVIDQPGNSLPVLGAALVAMECADALRRRYWMKPVVQTSSRWVRWSFYSCTTLGAVLAVALMLTSNVESNPFLYAIF